MFSHEDCFTTSEHIIIDNGNLIVNDIVKGQDLLWDGMGPVYFTIGKDIKVEKMNIL